MSQGTDHHGAIHDYEYGVVWYANGKPTMNAEDMENWFDTYDEAEADMKETSKILNRHRQSKFGLGIVRRVKAGPLERMLNKETVISDA